jgi:hypothetical protein
MDTSNQGIEPEVLEHLKKLVKTAGLPNTPESLDSLSDAWLEKYGHFRTQLAESGFSQVEHFAADQAKGAIVLTYSGSLLNIGPLVEQVRIAEYASIGLRRDVPGFAREESSSLAKDIQKDGLVEFSTGPILKSSPVYAIACLVETLEPELEEEVLGNVTMLLTQDFVEVNKTIISE